MFGDNSFLGTLIFIAFIFLYPRLMISQIIWSLEKNLMEFEVLADRGKNIILKKISKRPSKKLKDKISEFMEFRIAPPVTMDPHGIADKIHNVLKHANVREMQFVDEIAPNMNKNEKKNLAAALLHTIGMYQITKIIRHFLNIIKKYKILQLALILQMQIPLIKRESKALLNSVRAFSNNLPIGDGIGPLVIANMILSNTKVNTYRDEEFVASKIKIEGRSVILSKATGPGTTIGYPGKFVQKIIKKERINRIITIDAAMGLEGETDGAIAEGVGVGMRGSELLSYHSFQIEEIATKKNIVLDMVAIKEVGESSLNPMNKKIFQSVPKAIEITKRAIRRAGKNEKILIIGFGNTCGIGNNKKSVENIEKKLKPVWRKHAKAKKKKSRLSF